ncbi:hypothetical protein DL95DRAFT_498935 [Leptodontidium sp. 2 PMI_412]|nr:hypothetical protein DL95DRAFT_498935 [Leptodontidium sp. 2 PMI_412]
MTNSNILKSNDAIAGHSPTQITQRSGPKKIEWEFHRSQITLLYRDENRTLKEVMAIMKQQDFCATERMYKDRMGKWGLLKNIKEHEALAILRVKAERDAIGKDTLVEKHDQAVEIDRFLRHVRRKGLQPVAESSVSVPNYISCRTPPSSTLSDEDGTGIVSGSAITLSPTTSHHINIKLALYEADKGWSESPEHLDGGEIQKTHMRYVLEHPTLNRTPEPPAVLRIPEQLFHNISSYYASSVQDGSWLIRNRDGATTCEVDDMYDPDQRNELQGHFAMAGNLKERGSLVEFRRVLSKAFGLAPGIIQRSHPRTLDRLFSPLLWLIHRGLIEVALLFCKYIRSLSISLTSIQHPWGRIFLLLGNLDEASLEQVLIKAWQCNNDALGRGLNPFSDAGLLTRLNHIHHVYGTYHYADETYDGQEADRLIWIIYDEYERASDKIATQIPTIMLSLGHSMLAQGKYEETENMGLEILSRARDEPRISVNLRVDAMVLTARAQNYQRKNDLAESSMREAIRTLTDRWGHACPLSTQYVNLLGSWLQEWGRDEDAAELKRVADLVIGLDETDREQCGIA